MARTYRCSVCGKKYDHTLKAGSCCMDEKDRRRWVPYDETRRDLINKDTRNQIDEKRQQIAEGE